MIEKIMDSHYHSGLMKDLGIDWYGPPTNLEMLSRLLGIKEIVEEPLKVDAMSYPTSKGYKVVLNSQVSKSRQRFSWAHELAHIIIAAKERRADNNINYRKHTNTELEKLCDRIAAEILMPKDIFMCEMASRSQNIESISLLSNRFHTSITSTALRFVNLQTVPHYLVRWKPQEADGPLVATWQVRNSVQGPSIQGVQQKKGWTRNSVFLSAEIAYLQRGVKMEYEEVLTNFRVGNTNYALFREFRTESEGYGNHSNRFVLSLMYLNDQKSL